MLDVAHVLADGRVAGGAAHGREDVRVGVDDHGRSLHEAWSVRSPDMNSTLERQYVYAL